MVFKKPYAFFIKYFRLINLILSILLIALGYKLYNLANVLNEIFNNYISNYNSLSSNYLGFSMYLSIFLIIIILFGMFLLLKYKKKPCKDYLFSIMYIIIVVIYLLFIENVFSTLEKSVIEQTSLKLYSDISYLIIIPLIYFILKFILIVIGFNLKKFDFTKDIIELKQDEKDSEEIEIIFDKNTYKYKRGVNRTVRELKYYFLENKFFISIIGSVIGVILFFPLFSLNIFNSNKVNLNKNFVAGSLVYKFTEFSETKYDLNYKLINSANKYVIASVIIKNNTREPQVINLQKIKLFYGDKSVYPNNFYNKYFYDLGTPYNDDKILSNESKKYILIFKVPNSYKSKNYKLKIYDKLTYEDGKSISNYKELKVKVKSLDKERKYKLINLNENIKIGDRYGETNITLSNYLLQNNYIYSKDGKVVVYKDKDINKNLLILDYKLDIDKETSLYDFINNDKVFYNKFVSLIYNYNGKEKVLNNLNVVANVDNKIMLSVPFEVINATHISLVLNFRDVKIEYKLK